MSHNDHRLRAGAGRPPPGPGAATAADFAPHGSAAGAHPWTHDAAAVPAAVARQIDENLRRLYRRQSEAALPPELQRLVARLRAEIGHRGPDRQDQT